MKLSWKTNMALKQIQFILRCTITRLKQEFKRVRSEFKRMLNVLLSLTSDCGLLGTNRYIS